MNQTRTEEEFQKESIRGDLREEQPSTILKEKETHGEEPFSSCLFDPYAHLGQARQILRFINHELGSDRSSSAIVATLDSPLFINVSTCMESLRTHPIDTEEPELANLVVSRRGSLSQNVTIANQVVPPISAFDIKLDELVPPELRKLVEVLQSCR